MVSFLTYRTLEVDSPKSNFHLHIRTGIKQCTCARREADLPSMQLCFTYIASVRYAVIFMVVIRVVAIGKRLGSQIPCSL